MDSDAYDTTGMKCILAGAKCPGRKLSAKAWGCPNWDTITLKVGQLGAQEIKTFTGCNVLMLPEIQLTQSRTSNRVVEEISGYKKELTEEINAGFNGLANTIRRIAEAESNHHLLDS